MRHNRTSQSSEYWLPSGALDFGGGVETIVADGTDQPGLSGTTVSITVGGPDAWKIVRKKDGRTLVTPADVPPSGPRFSANGCPRRCRPQGAGLSSEKKLAAVGRARICSGLLAESFWVMCC